MKKNKTNSNKFDIGGYRKRDLNRIKKYRETDPAWFNVLKDFYFPTTSKDIYEDDFNAITKINFLNKYTPKTNLNLSGMGIEYTTPDIPEYVDVVETPVNEAPLPTIFANDVVNNVITKSKQPAQFTSLRTNLDNELAVTPIKPVIGKAGSIFIDMDDGEIRMIGDTSYRTYVFKDKTGTAFKCYLGIILIGVDNSNATDIGVKVYVTEANTTRVLSETEISTLAAQFIALLY